MSRGKVVKLTEKQRLYITGVRAGMSRRRAALAAGYAPSSANNPGWNIERRGRGGNPVMRHFWDMLSASVRNGGQAKRQFPTEVQPDQ